MGAIERLGNEVFLDFIKNVEIKRDGVYEFYSFPNKSDDNRQCFSLKNNNLPSSNFPSYTKIMPKLMKSSRVMPKIFILPHMPS